MVQCLDDLFSDKFLFNCYEEVAHESSWACNTASNRYQNPVGCSFSKGKSLALGTTWYKSITKHFYKNDLPQTLMFVYEVILEHFHEDLNNSTLHMVNGNLQLQGMDGFWHQDSFYESTSEKSVIFFPHYKWSPDWGGAFQTQQNDQIENYLPMPGRLILFDYSIWHRGLAPCVPMQPRYSVVYRFK